MLRCVARSPPRRAASESEGTDGTGGAALGKPRLKEPQIHTSHPPTSTPRERLLRIRVTDAEREHLATLAASQGRSLSEYVRLRLPLTVSEGEGRVFERERVGGERR